MSDAKNTPKKGHITLDAADDLPKSKVKRLSKTLSDRSSTTVSEFGSSLGDIELEDEILGEGEEELLMENLRTPRMPLEDFAEDYDPGSIDLSFPEHPEYESHPECYPPSYYTVSGKERLLLTYAENFRKQFNILYPKRRALVLAVHNECKVQKFVCTTIRPTSFLYASLIASLEGVASFVADFIEFKPLSHPYSLPPKLISPYTLLRRRYGNSFEMATLLCSMLIGSGFPAMVVSGSARRETVNNDQRNVPYKVPEDSEYTNDPEEEEESEPMRISEKYLLKTKPDLTSHLDEKLEDIRKSREAEQRKKAEDEARTKRETYEEDRLFKDPGRLSHAWVMIVQNAPWSIKPRIKVTNEDGEDIDVPPSVTFVEPSTGFIHQVDTKAYIHIESVWDNRNYYVNIQEGRIHDMKWDFRETKDWEHFLAGEPPESRIPEEISDENLTEDIVKMMVEKHLDVSRSWVQRLLITEKAFDERFRNKHKQVYFKRVLLEEFSSHSRPDGKMKKITSYFDDGYRLPQMRWEWFDYRSDQLTKTRYNYSTGKTEECFQKGRPDSMKWFVYYDDEHKEKIMHFYSTPRLDMLKVCEIHDKKMVLEYEKRQGECFYQEFVASNNMTILKHTTEKFVRNPEIPPNKDIAVRHFHLKDKKIVLKFHYHRGALTAAVREFTRPPKPDYGQEIPFNPDLTKGYSFNALDPEPTALELYLLLIEQLKAEEVIKKFFYRKFEEMLTILMQRMAEKKNIILTFKCFDSLRNTAARKLRMQKDEEEALELQKRWSNMPDFLAPYLVPYIGRALTEEESWNAYNMCLSDLRTRNVSLLNELQKRYEDLTEEQLSLKKFLNKFQNKFDDFDYERLVEDSKGVELNKRMVQKRLTITHMEAQRKYDMVKQALMTDTRLNLNGHSVEIGDTK